MSIDVIEIQLPGGLPGPPGSTGATGPAGPPGPPGEGGGSGTAVSVMEHGATGNGTTDDRAAIQAAIDTGAGLIFFPAGNYKILAGIVPQAGQTLEGEGYNSKIFYPEGLTSWVLATPSVFPYHGMVTVLEDNVTIRKLRFYGTKTAAISTTPKFIYSESVDRLTVENCWFENSQFEGLWQGGVFGTDTNYSIVNNYFKNVGYPAGAYYALPAIQLNIVGALIENNILEDVGVGIGGSGNNLVINGNIVRGCRTAGISTGDRPITGNIAITNNRIEVLAEGTGNVHCGILIAPGSPNALVSGNNITIGGPESTALSSGVRVLGNNTYPVSAMIVDNSIVLATRGIGIGSEGTCDLLVSGNTVRCLAISSSSAFGVALVATPSGDVVNAVVANNMVFGFTNAMTAYAYDLRQVAGATMNGYMKNCYCDDGYVRLNAVQITSGIHDAPFDFPSYIKTSLTGVLTIASGVVTVVGGYHRLDTEGAAASDDLDTISGGLDGQILVIHANTSARTVVAKDNTGNLQLVGDFTMDNEQDTLTLLYSGQLSKWLELSRSGTAVMLEFVINGNGSVITTGIKGDLYTNFSGTITAVSLLADQTGSIVVDIWEDTYANFPPVIADTITASAKPTITADIKSKDVTLTGWQKTISPDSVLRFNVDSCSAITRCTVALTVTPS